MRAKFELIRVDPRGENVEEWAFMAVTEKPFDEGGSSEDNSFSRWTPMGELVMQVTNPDLVGTLKVGEKYYLDFTKDD